MDHKVAKNITFLEEKKSSNLGQRRWGIMRFAFLEQNKYENKIVQHRD